jgi:radical SAM superfamily enzyme YgiQ (UPF0313 family)
MPAMTCCSRPAHHDRACSPEARAGSILLISCYELGHQPFAVASAAGFLERAGYAPEVMDIAVEPFDAAKVARARFVGISVPMHTALRLGVRLAERIRAVNAGCHVCLFGLYAILNADYLLDRVADSVIGGEFEDALVKLVRDLEAGGTGDVAGVGRRGRPARPILARLPFPSPARGKLPPLARYAHIERNGERGLAGYVEASRGCLHHCFHCPIPPVYGGRFFVIPRNVVLDDVRRQVGLGATHVTFGDADFLNGPGHSLAIVRAMHHEFPELTFDFTAKVEHILRHRALLPELGSLGCAFMVSAAESLSDTVLAHLDKGHTGADVYEALSIVRDAGIAFRPTWVPFTPWTTLDDYRQILDFVERQGLIDHVDPVQYSIRLLVPPGSMLLERPAIRPLLGSLHQAAFSYRWVHPDPRLDGLQQAVAAVVEEAARKDEDPMVTFLTVRELADAAAGRTVARGVVPVALGARSRPPRLTEPWFC